MVSRIVALANCEHMQDAHRCAHTHKVPSFVADACGASRELAGRPSLHVVLREVVDNHAGLCSDAPNLFINDAMRDVFWFLLMGRNGIRMFEDAWIDFVVPTTRNDLPPRSIAFACT